MLTSDGGEGYLNLQGIQVAITRSPVTLPGGESVMKSVLLPALIILIPKMDALKAMSEFSEFELQPGQRIGRHLHTNDMEWWVIKWTENGQKHIAVSFCASGESHEWVNDTGAIQCVFALKWPVNT